MPALRADFWNASRSFVLAALCFIMWLNVQCFALVMSFGFRPVLPLSTIMDAFISFPPILDLPYFRNTMDTAVCTVIGFTSTVYFVTVRDCAFSVLFSGWKLFLEGRWLSFSDVGIYCCSTI
jgi:hypothetical protein